MVNAMAAMMMQAIKIVSIRRSSDIDSIWQGQKNGPIWRAKKSRPVYSPLNRWAVCRRQSRNTPRPFCMTVQSGFITKPVAVG
jgi:hypothetical protein